MNRNGTNISLQDSPSGGQIVAFMFLLSIIIAVTVSFGRPYIKCICSIFPFCMESNVSYIYICVWERKREMWSKIIKIGSVFTKSEMNNEWNINFLQNNLLSIQQSYYWECLFGKWTTDTSLDITSYWIVRFLLMSSLNLLMLIISLNHLMFVIFLNILISSISLNLLISFLSLKSFNYP